MSLTAPMVIQKLTTFQLIYTINLVLGILIKQVLEHYYLLSGTHIDYIKHLYHIKKIKVI